MLRLDFWSLCRSGLWPVSGRPSLRALFAALSVCGLPRPRVWVDRYFGRPTGLCFALEFRSGDLFRCWFRAVLLFPGGAARWDDPRLVGSVVR